MGQTESPRANAARSVSSFTPRAPKIPDSPQLRKRGSFSSRDKVTVGKQMSPDSSPERNRKRKETAVSGSEGSAKQNLALSAGSPPDVFDRPERRKSSGGLSKSALDRSNDNISPERTRKISKNQFVNERLETSPERLRSVSRPQFDLELVEKVKIMPKPPTTVDFSDPFRSRSPSAFESPRSALTRTHSRRIDRPQQVDSELEARFRDSLQLASSFDISKMEGNKPKVTFNQTLVTSQEIPTSYPGSRETSPRDIEPPQEKEPTKRRSGGRIALKGKSSSRDKEPKTGNPPLHVHPLSIRPPTSYFLVG